MYFHTYLSSISRKNLVPITTRRRARTQTSVRMRRRLVALCLLAAACVARGEDVVNADAGSKAADPPASQPQEPLAGHSTASSSPTGKKSAASAPTPALKPLLALRATRPWSFTATVGPVALGTALAFKIEDAFSGPMLLLTLITTLGVHAAGNLMNTLFDFTKGVDTAGSSDLTLVRGELLPRQVAKLITGCYGVATAAAAPLCALSRAPLSLLSGMLAAGAGSAFVYTGGPGLKYKALGDILISTTFGPLLVAFAYAAQSGKLGWRALLGALPITMHIEAILHANNARDVEEDLASGVRTLAARLGQERSFQFYAALLGLPYLAPLYGALHHSSLAMLPLLTLPAARKLARDFRDNKMVDLPKRTAKFQFAFCSLFVLSVLLPSPSLASLASSLARSIGIGAN